MELDLVTWSELATSGGALAMVMLITQYTKGIGAIDKIPTQLWSYIVAVAVLFFANIFTGQFTLENTVLVFFNAAIVSLSANGGYSAIEKASTIGVTGEAMGTHAFYDDQEEQEDAPRD